MHPLLRDHVALLEPVPDVDRVDLMANAELFQIVVTLVKASKSVFNRLTLFGGNLFSR